LDVREDVRAARAILAPPPVEVFVGIVIPSLGPQK
jgi:hypothetical protein